ncbi:MAG: DUF3043 domain-containing protein [Propionibacteriaceae bacterium]|nr:DUF3043 domain-containing protein [Propionibacteriaceae bacterium]
MGLFKPYDEADSKPTSGAVSTPRESSTGQVKKTQGKKSIPTPTRKQAEAARRDRIQPVLTRKEVKAQERQARYRAQDEQMAKTNALPYNIMIRDWVDHRWNFAEFAMPLVLLMFVGTLLVAYVVPSMYAIFPLVIWGFLGLLILDTILMWFGCRAQLKRHFPMESMKGKFSYAMSRTMMLRRSRNPQPRVKRGSKFQWPYEGE